ncbi:MAG: hypothetical protein QOF28_2682 [Actinomycetota bacterium]|jgi:sortase (surface protein transpeptidase)|nr:hypothetical protein [Actinomycetota bacterium]
MRLPTSVRGRVASALIAGALVAGAVALPLRGKAVRVVRPVENTAAAAAAVPARPVTTEPKRAAVARTLRVPAALTEAGLSLRAKPVAVPLQLRIPSIGVDASVLGVGLTAGNVMDAPMGRADDPVWQQAFWYRGSAVPGAASTALLAGHIDGGGRLAVFAHIAELKKGDLIVVHDTRTDLDVRFAVTGAVAYTLAETTTPAVLTSMYGAGPVAGKPPQPSTDGLARLTLVTCAGTFVNGTHDHRLVVYATRIQ